jgi:hypothetical protein
MFVYQTVSSIVRLNFRLYFAQWKIRTLLTFMHVEVAKGTSERAAGIGDVTNTNKVTQQKQTRGQHNTSTHLN